MRFLLGMSLLQVGGLEPGKHMLHALASYYTLQRVGWKHALHALASYYTMQCKGWCGLMPGVLCLHASSPPSPQVILR